MFKLSEVNGKFAQRGDESIKNLDTLENVAQDYKVLNLIKVGNAGSNVVGVVVLENPTYENNIKTVMVTWDYYEFMDFTTESKLQAFNNFSWLAVQLTGAYSNKFKVGSGYNYKD